jgi:hypothetical protein
MADNYNTSTLKLLVILVPNFCDTSLGSELASRLEGIDPIKLAFVLLRASLSLLLLTMLRGHLLYLCKATIEENQKAKDKREQRRRTHAYRSYFIMVWSDKVKWAGIYMQNCWFSIWDVETRSVC